METLPIDIFDEFQTEDVVGAPLRSYHHAIISYRLTKMLGQFDKQFDILPELEFELPFGRVKPDIAICKPSKINWLKDVIRPTTPPLLAIEILSPRQALSDLIDKSLEIYFPSNVPTVWVIIPLLNIVAKLTPDEQTNFTKGVLIDANTGISIDIDKLFE